MRREAILAIDMLRGFLEEGFPLYCGEKVRAIIPNVVDLLRSKVAQGSKIIFVCDNHLPDDIEFKVFPPHCISGAKIAGVKPSGTMPHAFILILGDTAEATLAFDRNMPADVPRIALVDTFRDEPEESIIVAKAMAGRLQGVRLDTPAERGRVTPDLVKETRVRLNLAGFSDVKILVSGGLDPQRIKLFIEENAPVDFFGVGSYISGAKPVDFTADLHEIEGKPVTKRGRIPGITPNTRLKRIL